MKEHIEQLIEKFWAGTASVEERLNLLELLNHDNAGLREKLEASFLKAEDPKVIQLIDSSVQSRILESIHEKTGMSATHNQAPAKRWPYLRIAVAASVLLAIFTITIIKVQNGEKKQLTAQTNTAKVKDVEVLNEGTGIKQLFLPDRSKVILYPQARIRYDSNFGKKTRRINLSGTARFGVSHDKKRPFTVLANGYATTALGTEFLVNGKDKGETTVELFSGKVVVQDSQGARIKDVYMKPGDELTINNLNGKFNLVNKLVKEPGAAKITRPQKQVPAISSAVLKFKLSPLNEVFARIEQIKKIKIVADSAAIDNKVFTGEFLPDDTLETMLSMICEMNNLEYGIQNGQVMITQK